MKYIFRGIIVFEYDEELKEVIQGKVHNLIPAFDHCIFISKDYKLISEFFDKAYRHKEGEDVDLSDIICY